MPWVIAQYTDTTIDLSNPATFRDLSKPMGALNQTRLDEFIERFTSFGENVAGDLPPFMYGSHYSTMVGVVLHFLMRVQPFAALHREMQGGHFDVADRLFSSIPRTWMQNTTQLSEVKEIIPEWFTTPEIFKNINKFDLGKTQDGENIGDVELPPWAKTPEEFIRINREALESDYVSEHLHEWIDLIFGYKQVGEEAIKANNVFFYLTYSGSVDRKALSEDEALRKATELQIAHFGQVPMQLFNSPHPMRNRNNYIAIPRPFQRCFADTTKKMVTPKNIDEAVAIEATSSVIKLPGLSVLGLFVTSSRLLCVTESGTVEVFKYLASEEAKEAINVANANAVARSKAMAKAAAQQIKSKSGGGGRAVTPPPSSHNNDTTTSSIISFDDDFSSTSSPDGHQHTSTAIEHVPPELPEPLLLLEQEVSTSSDSMKIPLPRAVPALKATNALNISPSGRFVISGGRVDGSVSVRELDYRSGFVKSAGDFRAHRSRVLCVSSDSILNANTDVVVSCDAVGIVLVWTVSEVRHLKDLANREIVISRRPQRLFRVPPCPEACCDISWTMGIVVVTTGLELSIFSVERDEKLRVFYLSQAMASKTAKVKRVALSSDGIIIAHVFDNVPSAKHYIVAIALSGTLMNTVEVLSPISFLSCPDHGDLVITGDTDGLVSFYRTSNLSLVFSYSPFAESPDTSSSVLCARLGPNPKCPAVLVISCVSGIFVKALPDFMAFERQRSPTALQQLVSVPLQTVRNTIQHAQNLGSTISENAGGDVHNLKFEHKIRDVDSLTLSNRLLSFAYRCVGPQCESACR